MATRRPDPRVIAEGLNEQQVRQFLRGVHGPTSATVEMPEGTTRRSGYSVLWTPLGRAVVKVLAQRKVEHG